jgi:hypothetical protein
MWTNSAIAQAQTKVTYADHVLPLIEANCAKCHNPDKRKGDLDLTTYSAVLKGGGSGPVVIAGNVDSSKLWKALTHVEEPTMPPNKPPLPEKELAVFRGWITGGLLETSGSKALVAAKPALDLALKLPANAKPEGPPPMPPELPLDPVVQAKRGNPVTGLAASPWAPLLAIAGQKQVLLYHATNAQLLGILPFPEGQPADLKFSRSGKLLLAAGGHAAKSGKVILWNIESGRTLTVLGNEYDTVLTADLSPDQTKVALGTPDRLVKIYSTATGQLLHKIKKHTDWVTAVAFSPNGEILASADRNGGLVFWDPDNGDELVATAGHKSAVTALSWRPDSRVLASASEDGTLKLWDSAEGKQAKTWNAHPSGVLGVAYASDGKLVSCGRDGIVVTWTPDGSKQKTCEFSGEPVLRCAFTHDAARVVACDFNGRVVLWDTRTGQRAAELEANPRPLLEQIAALQQRQTELQRPDSNSPALTAAETEHTRLASRLKEAQAKADEAKADFTAKAAVVARLKEVAAGAAAPSDIGDQLTTARAAREKARAANTEAAAAADNARREVAQAQEKLEGLRRSTDPKAELARIHSELNRLTLARQYGIVRRLEESVGAQEAELKATSARDKSRALSDEQKKLQQARADYDQLKATFSSKPE